MRNAWLRVRDIAVDIYHRWRGIKSPIIRRVVAIGVGILLIAFVTILVGCRHPIHDPIPAPEYPSCAGGF